MKAVVTLAVGLGACGLAALIPAGRVALPRPAATAPIITGSAPAVPPPDVAATREGRRALRNLGLIQKRLEILRRAAEEEEAE